ncbi:MAG: VOC family protein [Actinomycetota bacterium]|nr:VOC family protein [Actinomycetota bacterium]
MPSITAVHHIGLTVNNVEASIPWYMEVFGLTKAFEEVHHPNGPGYAVILSHPAGFNISLDHHPDNAGEPFSEQRTGLDHLAFLVSSRAELEAWESHLSDLEVEHSPITDKEWGSVVVFRDPDNVQLELIAFA